MNKQQIVDNAWREIEPHLEEQGYELIEVVLGQQGNSPVLRLFIDKPGGITLDDCAGVSQFLSPILDMADVVPGRYLLEVSSPGFDRPVRKPEHFSRFAGEPIKLRTHTPIEGRKRFKGILQGFRDGLVIIECDGTQYEVHVENLERANLDR